MDAQPDATVEARATPTVVASETPATQSSPDDFHQEQQIKARGVEEVQTELAALQSQRSTLQIERDRLAIQLQSHQAEGQKRLAKLKAQWSELENAGGSDPGDAAARERFAERARVEMESALMIDQEYRAQLEETEGRLQESEQKMRALRRERDSTQESQRLP